jgi:hypothetical protein
MMATSHYGELKEFAESHRDFMNASMLFDPQSLKPAFKLIYDAFGESNGINVARMLSLEKEVVDFAEQILDCENTKTLYQEMPLKRFKDKKILEKKVIAASYEMGDQVRETISGRRCIIHSIEKTSPYAKVFVDDQFERIHLKRLKLTYTRDQLYPEGYDLEQLFVPFKERKLNRDIEKKRIYKQKDIKKKLEREE